MSMQTYHEIKKMLCKELDDVAHKGRIDKYDDLDVIDKLTHSLKSVETIIAMAESQYEGTSNRYMPPYVYGGHSFDDRMSEMDGRSNAQRRNAMGQFSRDESYGYGNNAMYRSRDEGMVHELEELMYKAKDDETRMKFKRFIMDLQER